LLPTPSIVVSDSLFFLCLVTGAFQSAAGAATCAGAGRGVRCHPDGTEGDILCQQAQVSSALIQRVTPVLGGVRGHPFMTSTRKSGF